MTVEQELVLYLISCEPGIKDIYTMIKVYDRADFPFEITNKLNSLLEKKYIFVDKYFDNGTPNTYAITEIGKAYLAENLKSKEITNYIKKMDNPEQLLFITKSYIHGKNGL